MRIDQQVRGTRIMMGEEARERRALLQYLISCVEPWGFEEIIVPAIEPSAIYINKAGQEVLGQMYVFKDRKGRELCLRPEVTATIQAIAKEHWRGVEKKVWYFERCYRYERPQAGRYREFWQFGVEWINPKDPCARNILTTMAEKMMQETGYVLHDSVKRGLSYYTGEGFELTCDHLGAQKQVVGGGPYDGGIGFAVGFDRLMLARQ